MRIFFILVEDDNASFLMFNLERGRERDRQTDRETETERQRDRDRETERDRERDGKKVNENECKYEMTTRPLKNE